MSEYEGGECHQPKQEYQAVAIADLKPTYTIRFHNADNDEVGMMDFNGPGLMFEGNAEESAMAFMTWISQVFQQRLKDERNNEREALLKSLLALKKGTAGPTEYIQGRWDLIGEFQDVILERIEK